MLDRVVTFGDEWMPNRIDDPEALASGSRSSSEGAEEAVPERIPVTVFGAKPAPDFVERLAAVGMERCTFYVQPEEPAEVELHLDELAKLLQPHAGERHARI